MSDLILSHQFKIITKQIKYESILTCFNCFLVAFFIFFTFFSLSFKNIFFKDSTYFYSFNFVSSTIHFIINFLSYLIVVFFFKSAFHISVLVYVANCVPNFTVQDFLEEHSSDKEDIIYEKMNLGVDWIVGQQFKILGLKRQDRL